MRVFLAITCLVAFAAARPDVSHLGYNYHSGFGSDSIVNPTVSSNGIDISSTIAPTLDLGLTSTIAPALEAGHGLGHSLGHGLGHGLGLGLGLEATALPSTALPLGFSGAFGDLSSTAIPSTYGTLLGSSNISPYGLGLTSTVAPFGLGVTSTLAPYGLDASGLSGGAFGYSGYDNLGYVQHQAPIVSKHFYLHSAPEEARDEYHKHLVLGTPQKTYRVVFIKAPTSQTATRISASFAPTEEKTVIYVLSKKPEDLQINDIAAPPPTEPSKPEVFFIKYKTPEEAAHAQQQIQAQYDSLGGYSQLNDEGVAPVTSVVGSLGQSISAAELAAAQFSGLHHASAPLHHISAPLSVGAVHHLGSPLSTIAPNQIGGYAFGLTSTLGPAFSTLAPAISTIDPAYSTVSSLPSFTTLSSGPIVSTEGHFATINGDSYLPPKKH